MSSSMIHHYAERKIQTETNQDFIVGITAVNFTLNIKNAYDYLFETFKLSINLEEA